MVIFNKKCFIAPRDHLILLFPEMLDFFIRLNTLLFASPLVKFLYLKAIFSSKSSLLYGYSIHIAIYAGKQRLIYLNNVLNSPITVLIKIFIFYILRILDFHSKKPGKLF